jgi:hypothetical protein
LIEGLPGFDANGVLPPGDYLPTRSDFERRFVDTGDAPRRRAIYEGWTRHRQALVRDGLAESARQLLDGSYTTSKAAPGDIDVAVEVPITKAQLEQMHEGSAVHRLLLGPHMKAAYMCDAYPIYCLPEDDEDYEVVTTHLILYWLKWFGTSRDGHTKGRVWATVKGLR